MVGRVLFHSLLILHMEVNIFFNILTKIFTNILLFFFTVNEEWKWTYSYKYSFQKSLPIILLTIILKIIEIYLLAFNSPFNVKNPEIFHKLLDLSRFKTALFEDF